MPRLIASLKDRILQRSIPTEKGCWNWALRIDRYGYGHTSVLGKSKLAHRASYEAFIGEIPVGLTIDHLCKNTACVNPDHLEAVSNKENILRSNGITAKSSRLVSCHAGHHFTPENTYVSPNGSRHCRACNRARSLKYKRKVAS